MKKNWKILPADKSSVEKIQNALSCHFITAKLLVNRGADSPEAAHRFINAAIQDIRPPFLMMDMDIATRRIYQALKGNEKILIFGDYDVDGITATAMLFQFLTYAGANVSYYIPHRIEEGYGLKSDQIHNLAAPAGIDLIITVDCGSASHDAVQTAQQAGINVIIADHHRLDGHLPEATAVINPMRQDCHSGFHHLAGAGVSFCLLICLRKFLREQKFWQNKPEPNLKTYYDLLALGTIADMVPLSAENRILTKAGLIRMKSKNIRTGLRALMEICRIDQRTLSEKDVAFQIAPRLNAAGRMDHAGKAVRLMTTSSLDTARRIAKDLDQLNAHRKVIEARILADIEESIIQDPSQIEKKAMVLAQPGWHEGVLGIVASKLAQKYVRPVVALSINNGLAKGSARSIPGFDLHAALTQCSQNLESFGGHAMAAGLAVKDTNIDLFQKHFEAAARKQTETMDPVPTLYIDAELNFEIISDQLINEMEALKPFGTGNPEPLFLVHDIQVISSKKVGENHRRMLIKQPSGKSARVFNAIHFNVDHSCIGRRRYEKMTFRLGWNHWNGKREAQMIVEDVE